jgi:glutaredoxin-like protein NrdH
MKQFLYGGWLRDNGAYLLCVLLLAFSAYSYLSRNQHLELMVTGDFSHFGVSENTPLVIYTSEHCSYCKALKHDLQLLHVKYKDIGQQRDPALFMALKTTDLNVVPVIFIGDTRLVGYNPQLLNQILAEKGLLPAP